MAKMEWTTQQKAAIDARGGTVLVCAAAGSGKTAVLVERVIEMLCDAKQPCNADELLIVTFTRAAASQMRERIGQAIIKRLRQEPENRHLRRQQSLLPLAQISTIDSLCGNLVKTHFPLLGIDPDYVLLEGSQSKVLRYQTAQELLELAYREDDPALQLLLHTLSSTRDDSGLIETILRLDDEAGSHAFPERWLDSLCEPYRAHTPFLQSVWCRVLLEHACTLLQGLISTHEKACLAMQKMPELAEYYIPAFRSDITMLQRQLELAQSGDWDALSDEFLHHKFVTLSGKPTNSPEKAEMMALRNAAKERYRKSMKKLEMDTVAQIHEAERDALRPVVELLVALVKRFGRAYAAAKRERGRADFSDILHWSLELLWEKAPSGEMCKTALAQSLAMEYREVLVDEYQDVNDAQEMLFRALSRNEENLFFVGDIKQSIYGFRQAMPELFLEKQETFPLYQEGNYPAKIILGKNFRSRAGITETVNFLFRQLMHRDTVEISYTKDEELIAGASYPEHAACDAEIHLLDAAAPGMPAQDDDLLQARHIAQEIRAMFARGTLVQDGDGQRPLRLGDICILMRGVKHAQSYIRELSQQGYPAYMVGSGGFFEAKEVRLVLALLQVLDNPMQDIPLLSVLLSPLFGFTADELARLRIGNRRASLYQLVQEAEGKYQDFLLCMQECRLLSAALSPGELLLRLYEDFGLLSLVGAMRSGEQRQANLRLLMQYAQEYQQFAGAGLSGFLRFLESLQRSKGELDSAGALPEHADVIRIMTIHKSKGLEFPVVFLARCSKQFVTQDEKGALVLSKKTGIGLRLYDMENYSYHKTAAMQAAIRQMHRSMLAEEMRLLYVALTRAKEKLITVSVAKDAQRCLSAAQSALGERKRLQADAVLRATSFDDWLLPAVLRHPDAHALRMLCEGSTIQTLPAAFGLKTLVVTSLAQPAAPEAREESAPDAMLQAQLEEQLDYVYPYRELGTVVAKQSASELVNQGLDLSFFAASKPAFLCSDRLTPAQRGTATHRFLQYANLSAAKQSCEQERDRLVQAGILSTQEGRAVRLDTIQRFLESDLAARLMRAEYVQREYKFAVRVPATELYSALPQAYAQEYIVVQGVVDCMFVENGRLVVLDYKTDRVTKEEALLDSYRKQVLLYCRALENCLEIPVKESYLYSFALNKAIPVK